MVSKLIGVTRRDRSSFQTTQEATVGQPPSMNSDTQHRFAIEFCICSDGRGAVSRPQAGQTSEPLTVTTSPFFVAALSVFSIQTHDTHTCLNKKNPDDLTLSELLAFTQSTLAPEFIVQFHWVTEGGAVPNNPSCRAVSCNKGRD